MARNSLIVVCAWVLSLVGVGLLAQSSQQPPPPAAQGGTPPREVRPLTLGPQTGGQVYSGDNIGIRVTGEVDRNGSVQGTLVVKMNGQWVNVSSAPKVVK
jgi:hypothetical protein